MDVELGSVVQDVPSEPLGIYSILFGTLSFVGAAQGIQKGKLLEVSPFGGVVCNTTTFKLRRSFAFKLGWMIFITNHA